MLQARLATGDVVGFAGMLLNFASSATSASLPPTLPDGSPRERLTDRTGGNHAEQTGHYPLDPAYCVGIAWLRNFDANANNTTTVDCASSAHDARRYADTCATG